MFSSRGVRIGVLVPVFCVLSSLSSVSWGYAFAGGTGEPKDPYQIATAAQLISIGSDPNLLSKHFVLVADIDLAPNLPGGKVFDRAVIAPDVSAEPAFQGQGFNGVLDGQGHNVRNMTIQKDGGFFYGLFGEIAVDGQVCNLGLDGVSIKVDPSGFVGGLVGSNRGFISKCHSIGTISSTRFSGGLAGRNLGGVISHCYSGCDVSGAGQGTGLGGLVGDNFNGEISTCYAGGVVAGFFMVGGLVGSNSQGRIDQSYATGSVSGTIRVGGLAGGNFGTINNCYAIGRVSGDKDASGMGGLVGENGGGNAYGSIAHCFWNTETSGMATSAGGTGLTTAQMIDIRTYLAVGWDFVGERANGTGDIWQMPKTKGYPILTALSDTYKRRHLAGAGTSRDPYQIATAEDLGAIRHYDRSVFYRLTADVDLSGITWTSSPIGDFDGSFDGNGHIVSHLILRGSGNLGLFGVLGKRATVRSLGIADANIVGLEYAQHIGMLAADNMGEMTGCYAVGTIRGQKHTSVFGGLVGGNGGKVRDCYARGSVTGGMMIGGLVGANGGELSHCYAAVRIVAEGGMFGRKFPGGLVGFPQGGGTATGCYFLGTGNGDGHDNGTGVALTDEQMKQKASFAGWDFLGETANGTEDIWTICEGKDYPRLKWEKVDCGK